MAAALPVSASPLPDGLLGVGVGVLACPGAGVVGGGSGFWAPAVSFGAPPSPEPSMLRACGDVAAGTEQPGQAMCGEEYSCGWPGGPTYDPRSLGTHGAADRTAYAGAISVWLLLW